VRVAARLSQSTNGRSVQFQIQPGLFVRGDERLLEIVLTNLLENAVKYTARTPEANIQIGRHLVDNTTAFYVKDDGVGFDPNFSSKLFTAFQRLHKSSDFPGTGIGLATVQRIVHRHGGRVWADSRPNEGATFYFTLPEPDSGGEA